MYDDELFTTIDYEEEGRDSLAFDPLSSPGQSDPVLKKFDKHGQFIEDDNNSWFKSSFSSQPKPTKAETDLVPMVEDSRFADDYSWWRKEDDYREWLRNQNLDPDKLDSYTGNKLFTEYIAYKAEHPDGFMKFSGDVMAKVGGVIRGVSDLLNKIPGIKHAVKPIGSILQFIGNIADMPRNVLAGAFTALATNNPEEILPNIFDAFKFSIGEVTGNEEGGKYFSWMDAKLMNLVEKAKQGMSEKEYDKYINSDSFRQTKRFWQTGGLLLDLALDPAWFMGAFTAKSMKAAKTLNAEGKVFTEILDRVADIERTSKKMGIMSMDDVTRTITGDMNLFVKRSEKLIDFVAKDKSFVKAIGLETYEFGKSVTDDIDAIGKAYRNAAKGELKSFETAFRLKIPLTDMDIRLSPSMDPLIDAVTKKIGGKPRGFLSIQGRQTERATAMLGQFSNVQEVIFRGAQDIGKAIDDLAAGGGDLGKMASEILKSPDQYKDLVAALYEANTPRLFEFIGIPTGEHAAKQKALFAVHEPLFKELLANPTIQTLRKDLDELFDGSYNKLQDAQRIHMRTAILAGGNVDDVADLVGVERKTIGEIYDKQYMKGRKRSINYGPESAMSTKYFYRQQSEEFLNWLKENELLKEFTDDPIKAQQVAADYMRIVRIPTDYKNDFLAKVLFNDDVRVALGDLFTEGRMDPAKINRFKEAMAGIRQQSDQFNQWAKESGVGKAAPKNDYRKFKDLLARDEREAFLMMNEKIRDIARVDRPFYKKLTEWSTKLDENGIPIKWDRVADTASDIRPLVTDASTSLMNDLSQKGLIFRGFTGRLYEGGFEPIYRKVLNDQRMIERLNSMSAILLEGQKGGWLKKINSPNDMINLDKSFVQINEGLFKGFAVQDYLEKPLQNAMKGIQNIVNEMPGNTNWVLERGKEYLEGFNRWWKVNIYMKNPAAHSRNMIANRLIMWGDGVSPWNMFSKAGKESRQVWKYKRATDKYQEAVIKGGDTAMLKARMNQLGTETIDFAGRRVSVMEATETLMRENILSSGFTTTIMDEIHKAGETGNYKDFAKMKAEADKSFVKKWNPFGIKDEWAENFRNMGSWIENRFGRLEHFFTLTGQQGKTIREAADQTNRILIDYGRISKTEDSIRKYLIPFYTWTSRMIPIMFEKAITQPVYFSKVTQLKNNAYKILELDKNYAPLGEQVMEGIPSVSVADIPKFIAGKPMNEIRTQYLSGEGWLPQAVVNLFEPSKLSNLIAPKSLEEWLPVDLGKNILTGAVDYAGGSITPGIKVILESVSGYSFQYKRPLQVTPDQTVKFLSFNMSPKQANILRSVFGSLRHADDIINTWDKNAITGRPKYTVYDVLWKNLLGYRPYNRDEIREIKGTLGELKQIYQSNLADARKKVYEPGQAQKHAHNALMAMHGIKALEWYRDFATEVRDKEATVRGIEQDIETLIERMQNPNLNKKQRAKYQEQEMTLQERLAAFMADQDKF